MEQTSATSTSSSSTGALFSSALLIGGWGEGEMTRYVHGPGIDEPLAMERGGSVYYYHADGLGSVVALTDSTGKVAQAYEYDAFGRLHDRMNAVKQPYAYTGREWDRETGLYYYRARYYDAETGRFISKDSIGFRGGMNLYGYVENNSVNFNDPEGLQAEVLIAGWTVAVAEPTPVGEIVMVGVTIGVGLYEILNSSISPVIPFPIEQCEDDTTDSDRQHCILLYYRCQQEKWKGHCDDCLNYCTAQGVWPFNRCHE